MKKAGEMGGRRPGEKASSFSVTCSLLSQYLKEKGGLGDLGGLGISAAATAAAPYGEARGKPETLRTMNLLPGVEAAGGDGDIPAAEQDAASERKKGSAPSMDLFLQRAGFGTSDDKKPELPRDAQRGQMTIFYGGKVMVFDNFPADKARDLMAITGRGCPAPARRSRAEQPAASAPPQRPSCLPPAQHNPVATAAQLASTSEAKCAAAVSTPAVVAQEGPQTPTPPPSADLPIARRASLHRFLEKRKDRISSKAPYPVNAPSSPSPAIAEESRRWLGLAPHVSRPEDLHLHG